MNVRKIKVTDLMPQTGKDLISYSGKQVIEKIGPDIIRDLIVSTLCGQNIRNLTEDLTRRRVAIINGALLTLFVKGCNNIDDFINKIPYLVGEELKQKTTKVDRDILLWLLGLTGKGVQNILRSKPEVLEEYVEKLQSARQKIEKECVHGFGDLSGTIKLDGSTAALNWRTMLALLSAIGTQTLAIRGAEKSMYGKLFERLVLGSCLSVLGFRKVDPNKDKSCDKVFWLSSRGSKRESDATALYKPGKGVRFDIGFIGHGNTEISLDKVSRFEREMDFGRQKHFMATFIIVDRIGDRSRIAELAKKIDGTIIQMSMAYWPQVLSKQLGEVLGFKHPIQKMKGREIESFIKSTMQSVDLQFLVE